MVGNLLLRGMLVGVFAGLLAFAFARTFGEPQVDRAIAFEEQLDAAKGEAPEPELVSRETQAGLGLFTGVIVYGAALGGLFSLVFAYAYGRVSALGVRATSALVALAGFVAVVLVPFIKYPANPPSVGNPETIGPRTALFFIMLVLSIAVMVFAIWLARRLRARYGDWNAVLIAGAAFIIIVAVIQLVLPAIDEVPENFSAVVLWRFRVASLGIQLILWATIGLLFGGLTEKSFAGRFAPKPARPALR
ncbi:MAG TPA: CbtA family protein [Rhizobiaceae bacterium]|nr:CbtA family protein [Rhizobiaceae bacterium]